VTSSAQMLVDAGALFGYPEDGLMPRPRLCAAPGEPPRNREERCPHGFASRGVGLCWHCDPVAKAEIQEANRTGKKQWKRKGKRHETSSNREPLAGASAGESLP
jgi:hypothetical protein